MKENTYIPPLPLCPFHLHSSITLTRLVYVYVKEYKREFNQQEEMHDGEEITNPLL